MIDKKRTVAITTLVLTALLIGFVTFDNNQINAESKTVENTFNQTGIYLQEHPSYFEYCLDTLDGNKEFSEDEVVAWVNDIPITKIEFELRKALREHSNCKIKDNSGVFNILVEEKIVLSEAKDKNLLPSEQEVTTNTEYLKQQYENDNETKVLVDSYCKSSNVSLEDYWNVITKYYEYRGLVLQKVYENTIAKAVKSGKLVKENSIKLGELNEQEEYWKNVKLQLKSNAQVKINPTYSNLELQIDNKRLNSIAN